MQDSNEFIGAFGSNGGGKGVQGAQGFSGIQGIQGTSGIQGIQGIQGSLGFQGIQGIQGVSGSQGTQGIAGGLQGSQGVQGGFMENGFYFLKLQGGSYAVNNLITTTGTNNNLGNVDNMSLFPHVFQNGFVCGTISINCVTGLTSTNGKIVIYSHNYSTGYPQTLLFTSVAFSLASAVFITTTINFTFQKNTIYWIGIVRDTTTAGNAVLRGWNRGIFTLGLEPTTLIPINGYFAQNVNYASPPNPLISSNLIFANNLVVRHIGFSFRIDSNI